ncbi:heterokaryon incompatibility protein-domain-containing protein [Biscogniauxia mediterranea]|nr:heterokaryon incompatibility protein-domain-containing protein [Biscogniauxia mediterranea]
MEVMDTATILCGLCASIFSEGSYEQWEEEQKAYDGPRILWRPHHRSSASLKSAAEEGCWICFQLVSTNKAASEIRFRFSTANIPDEFQLEFHKVNSLGLIHLATIRIYPDESDLDELAVYTQLRRRSRSRMTTGHEDVALVARWLLSKCVECHASCSRLLSGDSGGGWRPPRLLDISQDQVRLVLTDEEDIAGPYATLSHCWGKEKFLVLNSENFSQFTAGIHVGKFPKTFQETMTTVRRLGIKYLWIDCYCIVQGDEEDWKQQASQMDKVYTNSHINVGAAKANSPVDGLFSEREGCDEAPPASIRWSPRRYMSPVYFRLCDAWYNHRIGKELSSLSNCTLFRRGWVLQECVLAPRMLTFSRDQIIWQCSEVVACEAHPELGDPIAVRFGSPFWMLSEISSNPDWKSNYEAQWFLTLSTYSRSELTYPEKDVLEAVSGIGKHLGRMTGCAFRYGIFGSTMMHALLWMPNLRYSTVRERYPRRCEWRLPSWHWCSPTNGVEILGNMVTRSMQKRGTRRLAYVFMSDDCKPLSTSPESKDFWPNLLCIGRVVKVGGLPENEWLFPDEPDLPEHPGCAGAKDVPRMSFKSDTGGKDLVCLPLFISPTRQGPRRIYGLLLWKQDNGAYRRLGAYYSNASATLTELTRYKPQLIVLE